MFKNKDKVVCVEVPHFSKPIANGLTVGKIYEIIEIRQNQTSTGLVFFVTDDTDHSFGFSSQRFISIPEFRKRKIKRICSKLVT